MKTITIDRTFGSGGREIALIISKRAGIPYFDSEIILKAAEDFGVDVGVLKTYDENYVGSLIYNLAMFSANSQYDQTAIYRTYFAVAETIRRLNEQNDNGCVFIGRCADVILGEKFPVVKTYVYSTSMENRIKRITELEGDDGSNKMESYILRKDKQRRNYYQFFTDNKWGAPGNYDIMLNTATIDYEKCADILIDLASL